MTRKRGAKNGKQSQQAKQAKPDSENGAKKAFPSVASIDLSHSQWKKIFQDTNLLKAWRASDSGSTDPSFVQLFEVVDDESKIPAVRYTNISTEHGQKRTSKVNDERSRTVATEVSLDLNAPTTVPGVDVGFGAGASAKKSAAATSHWSKAQVEDEQQDSKCMVDILESLRSGFLTIDKSVIADLEKISADGPAASRKTCLDVLLDRIGDFFPRFVTLGVRSSESKENESSLGNNSSDKAKHLAAHLNANLPGQGGGVGKFSRDESSAQKSGFSNDKELYSKEVRGSAEYWQVIKLASDYDVVELFQALPGDLGKYSEAILKLNEQAGRDQCFWVDTAYFHFHGAQIAQGSYGSGQQPVKRNYNFEDGFLGGERKVKAIAAITGLDCSVAAFLAKQSQGKSAFKIEAKVSQTGISCTLAIRNTKGFKSLDVACIAVASTDGLVAYGQTSFGQTAKDAWSKWSPRVLNQGKPRQAKSLEEQRDPQRIRIGLDGFTPDVICGLSELLVHVPSGGPAQQCFSITGSIADKKAPFFGIALASENVHFADFAWMAINSSKIGDRRIRVHTERLEFKLSETTERQVFDLLPKYPSTVKKELLKHCIVLSGIEGSLGGGKGEGQQVNICVKVDELTHSRIGIVAERSKDSCVSACQVFYLVVKK